MHLKSFQAPSIHIIRHWIVELHHHDYTDHYLFLTLLFWRYIFWYIFKNISLLKPSAAINYLKEYYVHQDFINFRI